MVALHTVRMSFVSDAKSSWMSVDAVGNDSVVDSLPGGKLRWCQKANQSRISMVELSYTSLKHSKSLSGTDFYKGSKLYRQHSVEEVSYKRSSAVDCSLSLWKTCCWVTYKWNQDNLTSEHVFVGSEGSYLETLWSCFHGGCWWFRGHTVQEPESPWLCSSSQARTLLQLSSFPAIKTVRIF